MYTVLLSGGSGKRLWPLSNDLRSKQYIKIFEDEKAFGYISMIQRVFSQLKRVGLAENTFMCAGNSQVEIIHSQLGAVDIAVEPERRDTFAAVAISCAYAVSKLGAKPTDVITVLPVDPYTEDGYFYTLKALDKNLKQSGADIALMGVKPSAPSEKYGYILPLNQYENYFTVKEFYEKPDINTAKELIKKGAVYNCGVFCFKIELIFKILEEMRFKCDYDFLYKNYEKLPKISFDYQVLEKCKNMIAVSFDGIWKDLGTWDSLAEEMQKDSIGYAITEECNNLKVINELEIPIIAKGIDNAVIVAGADGILVSDRKKSETLKGLVEKINLPPMYEERRWGTLKTVDRDSVTLTKHIKMFSGMNSSYHYHKKRNEVWVFLKGEGEMVLGNTKMRVSGGMSVTIPKGANHIIKADTDLEFLEVHIGAPDENDIHRIHFDWQKAIENTL